MWHRVRRTAQLVALLALLSPLAGLTLFLGTYTSSLIFGRLHLADPFAALQAGVLPLLVAVAPILALNLILGRFFCGWLCPLGLLLELVEPLRRRLGLRDRRLPTWARYPLALILLTGSLLAGQPLYEWLGPQANLARWLLFGFTWEIIVLPAVLLADVGLSRRLWCATLCPAGVTYGLVSRLGLLRVALDPAACHKCGACLKACPQGPACLAEAVAGRGEPVADPTLCIACGDCIDACPERSLRFAWSTRPDPARRAAVVTIGAAALVMALGTRARALLERPRPVLRPPGAQAEGLFLALCIRCGKCAQVCPRKAIRLDGGAPYIDPSAVACDMCRKCPPVCPSGALTLGLGDPIHMGTAVIDHDRCFAWQGTLCRSCFAICPLQEKAILLDRSRGAVWRPVISEPDCSGCGLCQQVCPAEGGAIRVRLDK